MISLRRRTTTVEGRVPLAPRNEAPADGGQDEHQV